MEQSHFSDEQLMEQIAGGNTDALSRIAILHQERVLSLAYRNTGNWADAEDIAQETFIRVFKSVKQYRAESGFKTWLYRIVVNLCLDHHRKKKPTVSLETIASDFVSETDFETLETQEISNIVQKAVHALPERQKMALILHRYENLTHAEISDVTGWTKSAVESLLVRAYGNLRETLEKYKNLFD